MSQRGASVRRFAILGARPERVSLLGRKAIAKLLGHGFTLAAWLEGEDEVPLPWDLERTEPLEDFSKLGAPFVPKAGLAKFADRNLEFVLQLDEAVPHPNLLRMARNGVWRFATATLGPLAFWDAFDGLYHLEVRLDRQTERPEWSIALDRRWLPVNRCSYRQTLDAAIDEMAEMPLYAATVPQTIDAQPLQFPRARTKTPSRWDLARMLAKLALRNVWAQASGIFFSETWKVGVVDSAITEFADPDFLPAIRWLPSPGPKRFLADPFLAETSDGLLLAAEDFDLDSGNGRIVQQVSRNATFVGTFEDALAESYHMSYPFLLKDAGELYCIPETHQKGGVSAWRWDPHSRGWKEPQQVFGSWDGNIACVDPTLIEHQGRWWLFCTDKNNGVDSKLLLYFADSPWGPWTAHARNPVKVDIRSSRPGGAPFVHRGELYRPAQDSSKHYGWRLMVNRVTQLTPTDFAEETIRVFDSNRLGVSGIHTLAGSGGCSVVDGRSARFTPQYAPRLIAHKIRLLLTGQRGD